MNRMSESEMTRSVSEVAQNLGFEVQIEPSAGRWRRPSRDYLVPVSFGRRLHPDLLVKHGKRSAVVEVKNRGVLFGGVEQVVLYADVFKATGVLCLPDDAYSDIPASVSGYAEDENVHLCPISKIGDVLTGILGQPQNTAAKVANADS